MLVANRRLHPSSLAPEMPQHHPERWSRCWLRPKSSPPPKCLLPILLGKHLVPQMSEMLHHRMHQLFPSCHPWLCLFLYLFLYPYLYRTCPCPCACPCPCRTCPCRYPTFLFLFICPFHELLFRFPCFYPFLCLFRIHRRSPSAELLQALHALMRVS